MTVIAPVILILIGLIYVSLGGEQGYDHLPAAQKLARKSKKAIVIGLSAAMFFSPCLEIETFFFTAGSYGWRSILTISLIYLLVTVTGIVTLVVLGARDWRRPSGTGWNTTKNKSRASPWWGWAFLRGFWTNAHCL